jgi:hypothetical protein
MNLFPRAKPMIRVQSDFRFGHAQPFGEVTRSLVLSLVIDWGSNDPK